ncbi:MORC family CW-type zinc finger protein 3-like isoform X2 [Babylonia areolata]|uniref:MORC family CW-type zinc finger protein 3-like isoform X2 n=1 Tax=Babylonia areolata TaxID=304850 RepID=UPI003FD2F35D
MSSRGPRSQLVSAKVHPRHLKANAQTHQWPFSAIAELVDNAYDPDVSADVLKIQRDKRHGKDLLVFIDNGFGMDLDHLIKMLSFGFCEKDQLTGASHRPIGQYGNGFKSGSMRLAKDALVFTVHKASETACVGLLSQTLCEDRKLDSIMFPMMEFTMPGLKRTGNDGLDMEAALAAILDVTPYSNEGELKKELSELRKQKRRGGTKIVLFNLRRNDQGLFELDFESDPTDIRNPDDEGSMLESGQSSSKVHGYRQSLRRYCTILYRDAKLEIHINGEPVQRFYFPNDLKDQKEFIYSPRNKGRDEAIGLDVVGIVDVTDVLIPTHNKQDFLTNTSEYRHFITTVSERLKRYCGKEYQSDDESKSENEDNDEPKTWVQCMACQKWRRLPEATLVVRRKWYCYLNTDPSRNRCDAEQEDMSQEEDLSPPAKTSTSAAPGEKGPPKQPLGSKAKDKRMTKSADEVSTSTASDEKGTQQGRLLTSKPNGKRKSKEAVDKSPQKKPRTSKPSSVIYLEQADETAAVNLSTQKTPPADASPKPLSPVPTPDLTANLGRTSPTVTPPTSGHQSTSPSGLDSVLTWLTKKTVDLLPLQNKGSKSPTLSQGSTRNASLNRKSETPIPSCSTPSTLQDVRGTPTTLETSSRAPSASTSATLPDVLSTPRAWETNLKRRSLHKPTRPSQSHDDPNMAYTAGPSSSTPPFVSPTATPQQPTGLVTEEVPQGGLSQTKPKSHYQKAKERQKKFRLNVHRLLVHLGDMQMVNEQTIGSEDEVEETLKRVMEFLGLDVD